RGLQRGIAEAGVGAIETPKCPESRESVRVRAARRPEVRSEESLAAEDAEVVGLRDSSCDVIPAATFVFGDGDFHAGIFGVDLGLKATEDVDGGVAELVEDPRIAVAVVVERGVPEIARALHDELDLSVA